MKKEIKTWIFVTGAPRSGTTFLGKLLSAPISVDYIHEPFNPEVGIPGFEDYYIYLRRGTERARKYEPLFEDLFAYRMKLRTGYFRQDSAMKKLVKFAVGSRGPFHLRLAKCNPFHSAAVIKDPIGCLMAEYMAQSYGVKPVIIVKHPFSFVASLLRMGWASNRIVDCLVAQPDAIEEYFSDSPELISRKESPWEQAAVAWALLNKMLLVQSRRNPSWVVVLHEKLSYAPVETVKSLYYRLELPWSDKVAGMTLRHTQSGNPAEARGGRIQDFRRDSKALVALRARSLTEEQREAVRRITQPLVEQIYAPDDLRRLEKDWETAGAQK